jgi:hypothetical protein
MEETFNDCQKEGDDMFVSYAVPCETTKYDFYKVKGIARTENDFTAKLELWNCGKSKRNCSNGVEYYESQGAIEGKEANFPLAHCDGPIINATSVQEIQIGTGYNSRRKAVEITIQQERMLLDAREKRQTQLQRAAQKAKRKSRLHVGRYVECA